MNAVLFLNSFMSYLVLYILIIILIIIAIIVGIKLRKAKDRKDAISNTSVNSKGDSGNSE